MRSVPAWLLLAVMLAGCTTVAPPPAPPPALVPPPAVSRWLADYAQQLRTLTAAELQAESDKYAADATPGGRLRHALALAASGHPRRDPAHAQAIANEVSQADGAGALRDAAALIALALLDQQVAEAEQQRAQQRRRDDDRRIEALDNRVRDLERRAQEAERRAIEAERRAIEAEKKLSALKQIDKELSERASPAPSPAAPVRPPNGNAPR
jgi:hypothetical protein